MSSLRQQIAEKLLAKLAKSKRFDTAKLEQLASSLVENKKPKADDFVKVFSRPSNGDAA